MQENVTLAQYIDTIEAIGYTVTRKKIRSLDAIALDYTHAASGKRVGRGVMTRDEHTAHAALFGCIARHKGRVIADNFFSVLI